MIKIFPAIAPLLVVLATPFLVVSCTSTPSKDSPSVISAVNNSQRSEKNTARDRYRNPEETLKFFDVQPDMTVVEVSPGGGWYTEILSDYLRNGRLYLAIFAENSDRPYAAKSNQNLKELYNADDASFDHIQFSTLDTPKVLGPIAPDGTADRVLTFRNVHNWMKDGSAKSVFLSFHNALKTGGILGVVEHRAKTDTPQDPKASSGYVREDYVIALAESVGFKLIGKSEINANPKDTADHPQGVWTLPPSLRLKEVDRDKYLAIGESDRMTLKFEKL